MYNDNHFFFFRTNLDVDESWPTINMVLPPGTIVTSKRGFKLRSGL